MNIFYIQVNLDYWIVVILGDNTIVGREMEDLL